jgi:hypothetical protein
MTYIPPKHISGRHFTYNEDEKTIYVFRFCANCNHENEIKLDSEK